MNNTPIKEVLDILNPTMRLSPEEKKTLPDITKRRILRLNYLILGLVIGSAVKSREMKKILQSLKTKK